MTRMEVIEILIDGLKAKNRDDLEIIIGRKNSILIWKKGDYDKEEVALQILDINNFKDK